MGVATLATGTDMFLSFFSTSWQEEHLERMNTIQTVSNNQHPASTKNELSSGGSRGGGGGGE